MKQYRKNNFFGWLAASLLLLTTSCADNTDVLQGNNGANTVSFTVRPQYQTTGTRAEGDILTGNNYISTGSEANVLIFAVYEVTEDANGNITEYTLAEEFGKGSQVEGFTVKDGQNAIPFDGKPVTLQFVFENPEKKYQVAFWAQNQATEAYNTADLQDVKVNYTRTHYNMDQSGNLTPVQVPASNNDETRDAFCAVSEVVSSSTTDRQEVTLRRPLAQVNVGTAGWDYEGAAALKPSATSYTKSTITLKGVAQEYNILTGKVIGETTDVTFDFAHLPAFSRVYGTTEWNAENLTYTPIEKEEYLKVNLDKDTDDEGMPIYHPYVGWEQFDEYRLGITGEDSQYGYKEDDDTKSKYLDGIYPDTEIFKYLSMCYVLVPEGAESARSTLDEVSFEFQGIVENEEGIFNEKDGTTATFPQKYTISNVPVHKNWRTNILGKCFFTSTEKFEVDVVPEYMGDYNYNGTTGSWPYFVKGETHKALFDESHTPNHTTVLDKETDNGFFSYGPLGEVTGTTHKHSHDGSVSGTYEGNTYTGALKMEGTTQIRFTTKSSGTVTIVQYSGANDGNLKLDDNIIEGKKLSTGNVRVYTIDINRGDHIIAQNGTQCRIFFVEVVTEDEWVLDDDTKNPNPDFKDMDGEYTPDDKSDDYKPEEESTEDEDDNEGN